MNCNSCNGCDIKVVAYFTPIYDAERFGVLNIVTPKQADIMVVTGAVNYKNVNVLKNIYDQIHRRYKSLVKDDKYSNALLKNL